MFFLNLNVNKNAFAREKEEGEDEILSLESLRRLCSTGRQGGREGTARIHGWDASKSFYLANNLRLNLTEAEHKSTHATPHRHTRAHTHTHRLDNIL